MTGNISNSGISRPPRRSPGRTGISRTEKPSRLKAEPSRDHHALRIGGRSTQTWTTEERRQASGRVEPTRPGIRRAQRTAYIIARFTGPSCHHVLIGAILHNLKISYSVEITELIDLGPCLSGIGAAPYSCLETCNSEIGSTE